MIKLTCPGAPRHTPRRALAAAASKLRRLRRLAIVVAATTAAAAQLSAAGTAHAATSGTLKLTPGRSDVATITDTALDDVNGVATFVVPAKRSAYLAVQLRSAKPGDGYRARVRILADGSVMTGFSRVADNNETILASEPTNVQVSTGDRLVVEGRIAGSNPVRMWVRTWVEGKTKPGWQESATDSSSDRISTAGGARVWGYLSSESDEVDFSNAAAVSADAPDSPTEPTEPTEPPADQPNSLPGNKPSAATTGVPANVSLTPVYGDVTVTQPGTVLNGLDIHGFVKIRAANVKITNSIVRGGRAFGTATGLITNYGYANLQIENVDVKADYPSVYFDGIKGNNFTARRVHVVGNVDSVKIHGDNVRIEDSLLENTVWYANDPYQNGGPTHNDNIQILNGQNLRITGNTIRGASNFAILGSSSHNNVNVVIDGNWLDGGHCTLKLQVLNGWSQTAVVTNNKFGPNRAVRTCAFTAYPAIKLTASRNVYEESGLVVSILRLVS